MPAASPPVTLRFAGAGCTPSFDARATLFRMHRSFVLIQVALQFLLSPRENHRHTPGDVSSFRHQNAQVFSDLSALTACGLPLGKQGGRYRVSCNPDPPPRASNNETEDSRHRFRSCIEVGTTRYLADRSMTALPSPGSPLGGFYLRHSCQR